MSTLIKTFLKYETNDTFLVIEHMKDAYMNLHTLKSQNL